MKNVFRSFSHVSVTFSCVQKFESSFERKKTETSTAFLRKKNSEIAVLLDLGFWHSVEEVWPRLFPTQNWFTRKPGKDEKIKHFDIYVRKKDASSDALEHFQQEDLGKKTQKSKNFLGKKSKSFLCSFAKILDSLGFLANKFKNFRGFLSTILKNLAKPCQDCLPSVVLVVFARVLRPLVVEDSCFRMSITLGVVLIRFMVCTQCVPGHIRSGSGVALI